ncbi:MAG: hypothetical protein R2942_14340 [Ignavibacteria bacterium]
MTYFIASVESCHVVLNHPAPSITAAIGLGYLKCDAEQVLAVSSKTGS